MRKRTGLFLFMLLGAALSASAEKLTVHAVAEGSFDLEMPFGEKCRLVMELRPGRNGQLNFRRTTLVSPERAYKIFYHSDDVAPWNINDVYLGANHGEPRCKILTFQAPHGLAPADLGTKFTDETGRNFYLYQIRSPRQAVFFPENLGKKDRWYFSFKNPGKQLLNEKHRLENYTAAMEQLFPAQRFSERQYLADGKALAPGQKVRADVFVVREVSDIVAPDAVLYALLDRPGQPVKPDAPELDAVLTQTVVYTFTPDGRCVIDHQAEMKRSALITAGFVQAARLDSSDYASHRLVVEGVLPVDGVDLAAGIDYKKNLPKTVYIRKQHCRTPGHFPVRFLQILKDDKAPDIGFVIGYDTECGIGVPAVRAKYTDTGLFLYHRTGKIYPWAIHNRSVQAGEKIHCRVYRQYFIPE